MSRLNDARDRLSAAVARLEQVLTENPPADDTANASLQRELAALQVKYSEVSAAASDVGGQLDQTIARLEAALES